MRPAVLTSLAGASALLYAGAAASTVLSTSAVFAAAGSSSSGFIVAEILRRFLWAGTGCAGVAVLFATAGYLRDRQRAETTLLTALALVIAHSGWMITRQQVIEVKQQAHIDQFLAPGHGSGGGPIPEVPASPSDHPDFKLWHRVSVSVFLLAIGIALVTAYVGIRAGMGDGRSAATASAG